MSPHPELELSALDRLVAAALDPGAVTLDQGELRRAIAARTRLVRQDRAWRLRPWRSAADATLDQARRAAFVRVGLAALLALTALVSVAVGARLLNPPVQPFLITLREGQLEALPGGGGEARVPPAFAGLLLGDFNVSPDGRRIATLARRTTGTDPAQALWILPDLGADLLIWDATAVLGDRVTTPVHVRPPDGEIWGYGMDWLADGSALVKGTSEHGAGRLVVIDPATGAVRRISPDGVAVDSYWPASASHRIVMVGQAAGQYVAWVLEPDTGEATQIQDPRLPDAIRDAGLAIAPDGSRIVLIAASGQPEQQAAWVLQVDPAAGPPTRITDYAEKAAGPNWSPTGEWIAYGGDNAAGCPTALSIVRPDGTDRRSLSQDAFIVSWDPDGEGLIVETSAPLPGAPLGGIVDLRLDGGMRMIEPNRATDTSGQACHPYDIFAHWYPGRT